MKMFENIIIFLCFGLSYYFIEIMFRGYSHYSMFLLSGLCGFLIGLINEVNKDIPLYLQAIIGTIIGTVGEGITGIFVNIIFNLNVWDYSDLPFTFFFGQCNLLFCIAWFFLSIIAIKLDDKIRGLFEHKKERGEKIGESNI